MGQFTYRLQVLLEQKERDSIDAQKALAKAESARDEEIKRLRAMELRQQELVDRRNQLRRELLEGPRGSATLLARDAQERSEFLRFMASEIERAKAEVVAQGTVVEECHERVSQASATLESAKREVDLLKKHRARLEERFRRDLQAKEELALDEIGNVLYSTRRRTS